MYVLQIHYHQHRQPPLLVAVIVDIILVLVLNPHQHCLFTVLYIYGVFCPTPWQKVIDFGRNHVMSCDQNIDTAVIIMVRPKCEDW